MRWRPESTIWLASGVTQVTVAHADLPGPRIWPWSATEPGITLVPDRYGNGTNVIALPADAGFQFSYGPGSFARHRVEAERLGLPLRILDRPDLAWDIDEPGRRGAGGHLGLRPPSPGDAHRGRRRAADRVPAGFRSAICWPPSR